MQNNINFKFIGGFGISQKEIGQKKKKVSKIIDNFYDIGIREFFIGYNPSYWYDQYGFEYSPNGRFGENEQITSFKTLKESVEYIHILKKEDGENCEVFLTINAWYYTNNTMEIVKQIIDEAISIDIDGLIIGNVETLEYLASIGYQGKIHISTILALYNQDDIQFFIDFCKENNLNLGRIILSRELTLKEIENLTSLFPDVSFEVFGQGDYCRYANGNCLAEHKYGNNRDLCEVVLKQGMQITKNIRYDFKDIITSKEYSDVEKQNLLNNDLKYDNTGNIDLNNLFITQSVSNSNTGSLLLNEYLDKLDFEGIENIPTKELLDILNLLFLDIKKNYNKYISDGLKDEKDIHNVFIKKVIILYKKISTYLKENILNDKDDKKNSGNTSLYNVINNLETELKIITHIYKEAINYFYKIRKEKGRSQLETYYRFLMYNRTSIPAYKFFNDIPNVKVLKIPLRGRHFSLFNMGLELLQEAINYPNKFINIENISGKYFHYDFNELDGFKKFLKSYTSE